MSTHGWKTTIVVLHFERLRYSRLFAIQKSNEKEKPYQKGAWRHGGHMGVLILRCNMNAINIDKLLEFSLFAYMYA